MHTQCTVLNRNLGHWHALQAAKTKGREELKQRELEVMIRNRASDTESHLAPQAAGLCQLMLMMQKYALSMAGLQAKMGRIAADQVAWKRNQAGWVTWATTAASSCHPVRTSYSPNPPDCHDTNENI